MLDDLTCVWLKSVLGPYSRLRSDLVIVLHTFLDHAAHLESFDDGWRKFMQRYLTDVQHIAGQAAVVRATRNADTASVPTSFLEEIQALRSKVEELSDEVGF